MCSFSEGTVSVWTCKGKGWMIYIKIFVVWMLQDGRYLSILMCEF